MDILLTHAYYINEDPHELAVMRPYPPLGILYLSSHLKAKGFHVGVYDATFGSREAFRELLRRERPPVVGIYCNLLTRRSALEMVRSCRAEGATVVLGGPDPANYPGEYLARGADVVVVGEGELTLEELLPHLARRGPVDLGHIRGLVWRDGPGGPVRTEPRPYLADLDAQPLPDRAAVDVGEYLRAWRERHGMGSLSVITARGCAYRCAWCSHAVFGYSHRRRSPERVVEELALLKETYRPEAIWFADDVFTVHRRWLLAYAGELRRRGLRVPFETISREDRLDEEVIRALAEMGCFRLWIGAESGSQRVLDAMDRRTDAARVREMVRLLQRHGIEAGMFIMLGYEGEEMADLEATVEHLKAANPDLFLTTLAYPIKGTPYYDRVADRVIALKPWEEGSDRDFTVAGRRSRRFYSLAGRWMVGEMEWRRRLRGADRGERGEASPPRHKDTREHEGMDLVSSRPGGFLSPGVVKAFVNAKVGRLGMLLTRHERE